MRIPRVRWVWAAVGLLLFGVAACWATVAGYKAYYSRDGYRLSLEADLEQFFGLPVQVGRTEAEGLGVLVLHDVKVWLPERRALVLAAPMIFWHRGGADNGEGSMVDIRNAVWTLGSEAWEVDDFSRILRASLQHDYSEQRVRQILLTEAQFLWPRGDMRLSAEGVNGRLDFAPDSTGRGTLTARSLNGHAVAESVHIDAQVDPRAEKLLPEVRLVVPTLPLSALGLDQMLGAEITQGTFAGDVLLMQSEAHEEVRVSGELKDVQLEQVTGRLPGGPLPGLIDVHVEDVVVRDRQLQSLTVRGRVHDLKLDSVLTRWGLAGLGGEIDLDVQQGTWRGGPAMPDGSVGASRLERMEVSGLWEGASLETLSSIVLKERSHGTQPVGLGGWHGQLRLKVDKLVIDHERAMSGTVDLEALPRPGHAASIERFALLDLLAKIGVTQVPQQLLPERVQFSQMGVRIRVDEGRLRVSSGKGPAGPALITLKLFGQDVPLVSDWRAEYDVDTLLQRFHPAAEQLSTQVREKLQQRLHGTTAPAPPDGSAAAQP